MGYREATLAKTRKKENGCDARANEEGTAQPVLGVSTSIALKRPKAGCPCSHRAEPTGVKCSVNKLLFAKHIKQSVVCANCEISK